MNYKDLNDYEIVYMIGENDEVAINLLMEKYKPIVRNIAKRYYRFGKKYGLELDDLIQEGYYALLEASKKYSHEKSLFYTYAVSSINNKLLNLLSRYKADKHKILNESISLYTPINDGTILLDCIKDKNAEFSIEETVLIDCVKELIYELNLDNGTILELKYNGFTNREIATFLDKSVSYVARNIYIIRKKLKENIEKKML